MEILLACGTDPPASNVADVIVQKAGNSKNRMFSRGVLHEESQRPYTLLLEIKFLCMKKKTAHWFEGINAST